jgi:hypothetical protein
VFVVLLAVLLLGFACACIAGVPPLLAMWSLLVLLFAPATATLVRRRPAVVRGSPAELQRFLF